MKKLVLFVFLFASFQAFGQFPNYTNINGRYKWIAGKFDSTFTIPSGSTPSLRTGGGTGPGALFYRTTDSTVYQYTGTQWIKLRAGVSPTDTAGIWISNVYRQTGTDSVYYVKGGTSTFAFRDSIGNVGGGGGGGKIYYFNGGVSLGTFGGFTMYELGDTAVTGTAANFTRSTTGNIANFITDVNRPGLLQIPAGVWTVDAYLSETGGGSNHAEIWVEVEKWDGSTITTIAISPIEQITNGNVIDLYTWGVSIPTTTLAVTDRIIIQFYISNTHGKTVTLYTQNGHVGEVHTTFTTGIGSLNGLTAPTQYFATGTSGTDFAISSSTATHTFNLPTASGTNRGALSSADWTTFNGKVGGSGTTNYVSKFTASGTIGNSQIFDNGTSVGVNTASPSASYKLDVTGNFRSTLDANINGLTVGKGGGSVSENTAFGVNALASNTTASTQTAVGYLAGNANTTQNHNTFIGARSGVSTTGGNNTFLGSRSGFSNAGGANNTFLGTFAGYEITTGNENTFVGYYTGAGITTGNYNTIIGKSTIGNGITTGNYNTIIGAQVTGLSSSLSNHTILADGQGNMRLVSFNDGNVYIGGSTTLPTNAGYKLDVNGTTRISGTELRLDNGTTGTINLYSNTPRVNFFSGGGYSIGRNGTAVELISGGSIAFYIGANQGYSLTAANGHVWYSAISGSAALARLDTGGSLSIGKGSTAAVASSIVELSSTTKGFLPPRMTNAQMVAISSPATGLVVYDTTNNKLNVYDGTNWVAVH
jgi:hypothetical protein